VQFKKEADKILMHELFLDMHIHPSIFLSPEKKEPWSIQFKVKHKVYFTYTSFISYNKTFTIK